MNGVLESEERLKEIFKSAIVEVLQERGELVRDLLEEIVEEIGLSRAISEGESSPAVTREQIFEQLERPN